MLVTVCTGLAHCTSPLVPTESPDFWRDGDPRLHLQWSPRRIVKMRAMESNQTMKVELLQ